MAVVPLFWGTSLPLVYQQKCLTSLEQKRTCFAWVLMHQRQKRVDFALSSVHQTP